MIVTKEITFSTQGCNDIINITPDVEDVIAKSEAKEGLVTVSVPGSTAGITTIEYEPGLIEDLKVVLEKLIPSESPYAHNKTWGDGNGFSHVRAAVIGPSRSFPLHKGTMTLGTWQQIVLMDFDNRARRRKVVVQVMGE